MRSAAGDEEGRVGAVDCTSTAFVTIRSRDILPPTTRRSTERRAIAAPPKHAVRDCKSAATRMTRVLPLPDATVRCTVVHTVSYRFKGTPV